MTLFYNYKKLKPNSNFFLTKLKKFYSITLQGVCGAQYRFAMVNVGGFGKHNDGASLAASDISR